MDLQLNNLGQLVPVLEQNQGLSKRCIDACTKALAEVPALPEASVEALDATDEKLLTLIAKADDAHKLMDAQRKPYTKKMDEIKSLFTTAENEVKEVRGKMAEVRNGIAAEKARRIKAEQEKQAQALAAQQAEIEVRKELRIRYERALGEAVQAISDRMWKAFYAQNIADIDAWIEKTVNANVPYNHSQLVSNVIIPANPLVNVMPLATAVSTETAAPFAEEWANRIDGLKKEIKDLVGTRKAELIRIAEDKNAQKAAEARIAQEEADRAAAAKAEAEAKEQALATQAEADKLNAAFEVAATAEPSIQQAVGTSVKLKYQPTSHAGYVAILQWWVQNAMHLMTLEELAKKLSFMVTAANSRLNAGEKIEAAGLDIIEDYTTRKTAKAA